MVIECIIQSDNFKIVQLKFFTVVCRVANHFLNEVWPHLNAIVSL